MGELRFDGRVALVTGAGRGLGRAHALELAARGATVVVNDADTSLEGEPGGGTVAERVAAEIRAAGGAAIADDHRVDVPAEAEAIVARALDELGRVDVVVNNAGNFFFDLPFADTPPDVVDKLLAVHVAGAFNVTRPAWRPGARGGSCSRRRGRASSGPWARVRTGQRSWPWSAWPTPWRSRAGTSASGRTCSCRSQRRA